MKISTVPFPIRQYKAMYDKKTLNLDHVLQRGDVWDRRRKAELIRSLFISLKILPLLAIKEEGENNKNRNSIIDGKQRLLSIFQFLNDEFTVPEGTIYCDLNDEEFDISGKRFSELDIIIQTNFLGFTLNISTVSDYTIEELERLIIAYNSGKPMNIKQLFKLEMGLNKALEVKNFLETNVFFTAINEYFNKTQKNNNEDILAYIRTLILLSDLEIKSFEYEDMINFIKEYNCSKLISQVKYATDKLVKILNINDKDNSNIVIFQKTDWTYYLKRLPYLLFIAYKLKMPQLKELLEDVNLRYIMPDKSALKIRQATEFNALFIKTIEGKIADYK